MAYKISSFIIGLIVFCMIISILGLFITKVGTEYAPSDYAANQARLDNYNKLDELTAQTNLIKNGTSEIKEKTGVLDVIGSFFSDAYRTLLITKNSFDIFDEMSSSALQDAKLGQSGALLRTALIAIIIICIFVGVILSALMKKDL